MPQAVTNCKWQALGRKRRAERHCSRPNSSGQGEDRVLDLVEPHVTTVGESHDFLRLQFLCLLDSNTTAYLKGKRHDLSWFFLFLYLLMEMILLNFIPLDSSSLNVESQNTQWLNGIIPILQRNWSTRGFWKSTSREEWKKEPAQVISSSLLVN